MAGFLASFLRESTKRRWQWGVTDCLMWPADWVRIVRGEDPAARWRGKYSSALGCARICQANGGVMALADSGLRGIGVARVASAQAGDFAIIQAPSLCGQRVRWRQMGAVMASERDAAVMTEDMGLVVTSIGFEPVAYWRVG